MTVDQFRLVCLSLSSNREDSDQIPQLVTRINTAMLQIAKDTVPIVLTTNDILGKKIVKRVDSTYAVLYPTNVSLITDVILMDDSLINAMANLVMASAEQSRSGIYMKQYWDEIANHEYSLTRDYDMTQELVLQDFESGDAGYLMEVN